MKSIIRNAVIARLSDLGFTFGFRWIGRYYSDYDHQNVLISYNGNIIVDLSTRAYEESVIGLEKWSKDTVSDYHFDINSPTCLDDIIDKVCELANARPMVRDNLQETKLYPTNDVSGTIRN